MPSSIEILLALAPTFIQVCACFSESWPGKAMATDTLIGVGGIPDPDRVHEDRLPERHDFRVQGLLPLGEQTLDAFITRTSGARPIS